MKTESRFIVVKSRKGYGYALKNIGEPLPFIIGPGQTCHWYKYKTDAISGAERMNRAYSRKVTT